MYTKQQVQIYILKWWMLGLVVGAVIGFTSQWIAEVITK